MWGEYWRNTASPEGLLLPLKSQLTDYWRQAWVKSGRYYTVAFFPLLQSCRIGWRIRHLAPLFFPDYVSNVLVVLASASQREERLS